MPDQRNQYREMDDHGQEVPGVLTEPPTTPKCSVTSEQIGTTDGLPATHEEMQQHRHAMALIEQEIEHLRNEADPTPAEIMKWRRDVLARAVEAVSHHLIQVRMLLDGAYVPQIVGKPTPHISMEKPLTELFLNCQRTAEEVARVSGREYYAKPLLLNSCERAKEPEA